MEKLSFRSYCQCMKLKLLILFLSHPFRPLVSCFKISHFCHQLSKSSTQIKYLKIQKIYCYFSASVPLYFRMESQHCTLFFFSLIHTYYSGCSSYVTSRILYSLTNTSLQRMLILIKVYG